jgi:ADP-heptose:LPS heptosyltransferase
VKVDPRFDRKLSWPFVLIGLLIRLVPPWGRQRAPIDPSTLKKVLIFRPDRRVGNLVISSCLVEALKRHRPDIQVDFLAPHGREELVETLPGITRVYSFRQRDGLLRPWRHWLLLLRIRAEGYDVAIDASHWHSFSFTAASLARMSGASYTIGHDRGAAWAFHSHPVEVPMPADGGWPREVDAKVSLLQPLGIEEPAPCTVSLLAGDQETAQTWWDGGTTNGERCVLLWPSSRKKTTLVSSEAWVGVAEAESAEVRSFFGVGWGPGEAPLAIEIVNLLNQRGIAARALPATSLDELAGYMRSADMVLTADTGPMHLAGAIGCKIHAYFRRSDGVRWTPPGALNRIYEADASAGSRGFRLVATGSGTGWLAR